MLTPPIGQRLFIDDSNLQDGVLVKRNRRFPTHVDPQVRHVCSTCNNGWMSTLEEKARPIITAVRDDSMDIITPSGQETLAFWAAKTAITGQYSTSNPIVPLREREWMFKRQECPPDTSVWLARYTGEGQATYHSKQLFFPKTDRDTLRKPSGVFVVITIGPLMLIVASLYFRNNYRLEFLPELQEHLFQLWPSNSGAITWPRSGVDEALRNRLNNAPFDDNVDLIVQVPLHRT